MRVAVRRLTKRWGAVVAVHDVSLEFARGAFTTVLGPSGCGKTTMLRLIAGLEEPTAGEIWIGDRLVFSSTEHINVPPGRRGVGLVFQSYALWPHMTVFDNVALGLRQRGLRGEALARQVRAALNRVRLEGLEDRYPGELSGGQQQRVALARMIAVEPQVLLLDEPLSNLDAKLRLEMRAELKRLHHELGITVIYVTHDQVEAMALSTRVAVMDRGRVVQYDTPDRIYRTPADRFVADFTANPVMNFLEVDVTATEARADGLVLPLDPQGPPPGRYILGIRPEDCGVSPNPVSGSIPFRVYAELSAGPDQFLHLRRDTVQLVVKTGGRLRVQPDQIVYVTLYLDRLHFFDPETGRRVEAAR
ncbi:MAG: ABC transporter ATP-binding protein [Armatimonadota bacterium]|nr:ABC transporter ATP-binding protein [Armatimonadota bacterium]